MDSPRSETEEPLPPHFEEVAEAITCRSSWITMRMRKWKKQHFRMLTSFVVAHNLQPVGISYREQFSLCSLLIRAFLFLCVGLNTEAEVLIHLALNVRDRLKNYDKLKDHYRFSRILLSRFFSEDGKEPLTQERDSFLIHDEVCQAPVASTACVLDLTGVESYGISGDGEVYESEVDDEALEKLSPEDQKRKKEVLLQKKRRVAGYRLREEILHRTAENEEEKSNPDDTHGEPPVGTMEHLLENVFIQRMAIDLEPGSFDFDALLDEEQTRILEAETLIRCVLETFEVCGRERDSNSVDDALRRYSPQNPFAQYLQGCRSRQEFRGSVNLEVFNLWSDASRRGCLSAKYMIAECLSFGWCCKRVLSRAAAYYSELSELDFTPATYRYAMCRMYGKGIGRGIKHARALLHTASQWGYTDALLSRAEYDAEKGDRQSAIITYSLLCELGIRQAWKEFGELVLVTQTLHSTDDQRVKAQRLLEEAYTSGDAEAGLVLANHRIRRGLYQDAIRLLEEVQKKHKYDRAGSRLFRLYSDLSGSTLQTTTAEAFKTAAEYYLKASMVDSSASAQAEELKKISSQLSALGARMEAGCLVPLQLIQKIEKREPVNLFAEVVTWDGDDFCQFLRAFAERKCFVHLALLNEDWTANRVLYSLLLHVDGQTSYGEKVLEPIAYQRIDSLPLEGGFGDRKYQLVIINQLARLFEPKWLFKRDPQDHIEEKLRNCLAIFVGYIEFYLRSGPYGESSSRPEWRKPFTKVAQSIALSGVKLAYLVLGLSFLHRDTSIAHWWLTNGSQRSSLLCSIFLGKEYGKGHVTGNGSFPPEPSDPRDARQLIVDEDFRRDTDPLTKHLVSFFFLTRAVQLGATTHVPAFLNKIKKSLSSPLTFGRLRVISCRNRVQAITADLVSRASKQNEWRKWIADFKEGKTELSMYDFVSNMQPNEFSDFAREIKNHSDVCRRISINSEMTFDELLVYSFLLELSGFSIRAQNALAWFMDKLPNSNAYLNSPDLFRCTVQVMEQVHDDSSCTEHVMLRIVYKHLLRARGINVSLFEGHPDYDLLEAIGTRLNMPIAHFVDALINESHGLSGGFLQKSLKLAYDGGYAYAALKLGIYQRTMGTADGDQAALKYYIEAADKGVAPAQFLLGRWYEAGNIVTRDSSRALSYYRRALAAGEIKAKEPLFDLLLSESGKLKDLAKPTPTELKMLHKYVLELRKLDPRHKELGNFAAIPGSLDTFLSEKGIRPTEANEQVKQKATASASNNNVGDASTVMQRPTSQSVQRSQKAVPEAKTPHTTNQPLKGTNAAVAQTQNGQVSSEKEVENDAEDESAVSPEIDVPEEESNEDSRIKEEDEDGDVEERPVVKAKEETQPMEPMEGVHEASSSSSVEIISDNLQKGPLNGEGPPVVQESSAARRPSQHCEPQNVISGNKDEVPQNKKRDLESNNESADEENGKKRKIQARQSPDEAAHHGGDGGFFRGRADNGSHNVLSPDGSRQVDASPQFVSPTRLSPRNLFFSPLSVQSQRTSKMHGVIVSSSSLIIESKLSSDDFCTVYNCKFRGAYAAAKALRRRNFMASKGQPGEQLLKWVSFLQNFRHPFVASIYGLGVFEEECYLVTERVDGWSLREMLDVSDRAERKLNGARDGLRARSAALLPILRDVARALAEMHSAGGCHLNLKSRNVLLRQGMRPFLNRGENDDANMEERETPHKRGEAASIAVEADLSKRLYTKRFDVVLTDFRPFDQKCGKEQKSTPRSGPEGLTPYSTTPDNEEALQQRSATATNGPLYLGESPLWLAPEILKGEEGSSEADVWAFGMLMYECLTGLLPWSELSNPPLQMFYEVFVRQRRPQLPSRLKASLGLHLETRENEGVACRDADTRSPPSALRATPEDPRKVSRPGTPAQEPSEGLGLDWDDVLASAWARVVTLMEKCWDENASKRPSAAILADTLTELCEQYTVEG